MDKLEQELKEFRSLQQELTKVVNTKGKFLTQLNENDMVKKELELLSKDSEVYKLVGPVLLKQEKADALANVSKRMDFINSEMKRIDATIKDFEKKQEDKKKRIVELQTAIQKQQMQQR